jgi:hypothetical protein
MGRWPDLLKLRRFCATSPSLVLIPELLADNLLRQLLTAE